MGKRTIKVLKQIKKKFEHALSYYEGQAVVKYTWDDFSYDLLEILDKEKEKAKYKKLKSFTAKAINRLNEYKKNDTMKELEEKLRLTLKTYSKVLNTKESREFVLQLIMRDIKDEVKEILDAFYYGEDLKDETIRQFYQNLHADFLEDLK